MLPPVGGTAGADGAAPPPAKTKHGSRPRFVAAAGSLCQVPVP